MSQVESTVLNPKILNQATAPSEAQVKPAKYVRPAIAPNERIDWPGSIPFILVHVMGVLAIFTGVSWTAVGMCVFMYYARMFAITGAYHRYFSHRTYKTSRFFQFVLGFWGASCGQQGPLWWAAHHRHHHKFSDTEQDIHSAKLRGLWWSHVGWIVCKRYAPTNEEAVKDLAKYPELRWLNKYHGIPPFILATSIYFFGVLLENIAPGLHTNGLQMIMWGFFTSTTILYHGTFCINSLAHLIGKQRFETGEESKNSLILSLITMGEGWHNNHHRYPYSERQGIYWWEIDMSHYILKVFSWLGLVWDIKLHPEEIYAEASGNKEFAA